MTREELERQLAEEILENSAADPTARLIASMSLRLGDIAQGQAVLSSAVSMLGIHMDHYDKRFGRLLDCLERSFTNGSRPDMKAVREEIYATEEKPDQ